jgi:hypothetical protein
LELIRKKEVILVDTITLTAEELRTLLAECSIAFYKHLHTPPVPADQWAEPHHDAERMLKYRFPGLRFTKPLLADNGVLVIRSLQD